MNETGKWYSPMTTPAHALARSRLMLTESDVDLIQYAVQELDDIRDLNVYDLGAGSGTSAAAVLSQRPDNLHGTTLDIDQENLDWSRKFVTGTWKSSFVAQDHFPVEKTTMVSFDPPLENTQWRWILSRSVPSWKVRNRSIHLLLIDTSHEYDQTLEELTWWQPRMTERHFVWLDDYTTYPGVRQAVNEWVAEGALEILECAEQSVLCRYLL